RTQDQIAKAVGKSRAHVTNTLRLLALPAKAFDALEQGTITPGHARAILAAPKPEVLLEVILQDGLSVRDTEQFLKHLTAPDSVEAPARSSKGGAAPAPKKASGGKKDADTRALESDLAAALGLEVEIDHGSKGAGAVTIRYLDLDQLDDICRRLMGAGI
ncbi:MAG TPA: chromosome partitioning protein ParB, partial [Parvularculaceae bacterium]|nr:chromosome partitioning protein ParB [Parvularculaceae bacterium]